MSSTSKRKNKYISLGLPHLQGELIAKYSDSEMIECTEYDLYDNSYDIQEPVIKNSFSQSKIVI